VDIVELANWILLILWAAGIPVGLFAFVHAALQRADAFTAVDKLTKPAWLGITGVAAVVLIVAWRGPFTLIWIAALVASLVYIVDVRPKVKEIQGRSW
jgi:asparagine N-glycosylation enzyme membrane subunit Stt3